MESAGKQVLGFTGSMDMDSDRQDIKPGDYFTALNFRNIFTENGKEGSGENISGNQVVSNTLPSGTNKCIGTLEDVPGQTVFYWIWNSLGNHRLYRYYPNNTTNKIQTIVAGSVLNFGEWDYVSHANLVGDLLYWVDNKRNPQRKINVNRANNTDKRVVFKVCIGEPEVATVRYSFQSGATSYTIDVNYIVTTREAAIATATATFNSFPGLASAFTISNKGEYVQFEATGVGSWNISVTVLSGNIVSWYKPVNFYTAIDERVLDVCGWPAWLEPDTSLINDPDVKTNYLTGESYQFAYSINYDDGETSVLSKYSKWVYNDKTFRTSLIRDYNNYDQNAIQSINATLNAVMIRYFDSGRLSSGRQIIKSIDIYVRTSGEVEFRLIETLRDYELEGSYYFYNNLAGTAIDTAFRIKNSEALPVRSACQEVVNNRVFFADNTVGYDNTDVYPRIFEQASLIKSWDTTNLQRPLSLGKYQFGIVYFDRYARNNGTQTNSSLLLQLQLVVNQTTTDTYVRWEIPKNMQPPVWATHYAWVRTRELSAQAYYAIQKDGNATYKNASGVTVAYPSSTIRTAEIKLKYPLANLYYSKFAVGDTLLLQSTTTGDVFHISINSYKDDTKTLVVEYNTSNNPSLPDLNSSDIKFIRIYTPYKNVEDESFYEFYECYNIINPGQSNRAHQGGYEGVDQVPGTTDASGFFYLGWDAFRHLGEDGTGSYDAPYAVTSRTSIEKVKKTTTRVPAKTNNAPNRGNTVTGGNVPSFQRQVIGSNAPQRIDPYVDTPVTVSDEIEIDQPINQFPVYGTGRASFILIDNRQISIGENVCFSNVYNVGTAYNGFGSYEALNNKNVSVGFGAIRKIQNIDNILLAVCENKAFSIYVDKGIIQGQDGSVVVSKSDEVIGTYRELKGLHGTINPESFATNDGLVFWWDAYRGEVCQYSSQGIDVISALRSNNGDVIIGMKNYFTPKGILGIQSNRSTYKVLGVVHKQFKEYIMSFQPITVNAVTYPAETLSYNYVANGWKTFYSYLPEYMCGTGQNIVSFKAGDIYVHAPSTTKNTFYGTAFPTQVGSTVNIESNSSKTFLSMSVESNQPPNYPTITTPVTSWNIGGQLSELVESDFEFMNGSYWGSFLKNKLTPNFNTQTEALINGEELQAQTMDLLLSKDSTQLFTINKATVYIIKDDLTN